MRPVPVPVHGGAEPGLFGAIVLFLLIAAAVGVSVWWLAARAAKEEGNATAAGVLLGPVGAAVFFYFAWTPLHLAVLAEGIGTVLFVVGTAGFCAVVVGLILAKVTEEDTVGAAAAAITFFGLCGFFLWLWLTK